MDVDVNIMIDILEEKGVSTENMDADEVEVAYFSLFE